jgi:hypothetical protein
MVELGAISFDRAFYLHRECIEGRAYDRIASDRIRSALRDNGQAHPGGRLSRNGDHSNGVLLFWYSCSPFFGQSASHWRLQAQAAQARRADTCAPNVASAK